MSASPIVIEPLGKQHDRSAFACGEPELDDWFRHRASQDERRGVARVFVSVDAERRVTGFYSLSAFTLAMPDMPDDLARKLPRYGEIPAALIGRLARDERARGQAIGELLLVDAIRRVLHVAKSLAVFAIVVDAKNAQAAAFYERYGFRPFPLRGDRLFLTAAAAEAAMRAR